MSVEAELKARVRDPDRVRDRLRDRADERVEVYQDTYYDRPDRTLDAQGRELRVRLIESQSGTRALVTYKGAPVDAGSGSKPEYETEVADAGTMRSVFRQLGYVELISFTKYCRNYRFQFACRDMLATLVTVPEIDGTFVEIETITGDHDVSAALGAVRDVLAELGVDDRDLTTELYTDAVRAARP